ncbi:MAG: hypothetical protein JWQ38_370 [Flavipsychrobacter sp.]|nr:hypothetical protein [Flavipsychrobacter sp.]
MKHVTKTFGFVIAACVLTATMYSCKGNSGSSEKCATDSVSATTTTVTTTTTIDGNGTDMSGSNKNGTNTTAKESDKNSNGKKIVMADETGAAGTLHVTSPAFGNNGVIPIKYTCDGQGVTPPIDVKNIPVGTKSLTLIVHDYNATPGQGFTYWLIWNLDTLGHIPENFRSSHEGMNAAKEYGNTPLCAKSGDHRYHFMVYAMDSKVLIGKNATKASIEKVMSGHVLAKGEMVGIYNKHLE